MSRWGVRISRMVHGRRQLTPLEIAERFSRHRFAEVYDLLADDVRWVLPGEATVEGKEAVVEACEAAAAQLAGTTTEFSRFVSCASGAIAACDATATYTAPDGAVTTVSSADVYELREDGFVRTITSYAVELSD